MPDFDRIRAELECARVLARFVDHLDRRDHDALLALTTPDCVWQGRTNASGHAQIRARLEQRPAGMATLHVLSNIVVTVVDAANARARSILCVHRVDRPDGPAMNGLAVPPTGPPHTLGLREDRLVRDEQGWRIAERRLTVLAQAPD